MALPRPHIHLPPLPTVRDLVKLYRLKARRQLSQNFLMDERITDKIVRAAGRIRNHYVCEVGPGPGSITRSIIRKSPKKLIVVEKDQRFLPMLELLQEAVHDVTDMEIAIDDIMKYNLEKCFEGAPKSDWNDYTPPVHLIGNLPFNVSTYLIICWLKAISEKNSAWSYGRTSMTLTFQKEVGERMVADAGGKQRCRLSLMCQMWCDVQYKFTIPGKAFVPQPEVDVAVMTFVPLKKPLIDLPFKIVEKVFRTVFNMRQKYCRRGISNLFPKEQREDLVLKLCKVADIESTNKPFHLSNEELIRICYAYNLLCEENPGLVDYDYRAPKIREL